MSSARKRVRLTKRQKALLELLRSRYGRTVTETEILETGLKPSTWRVYVNNGLYAPYLRETARGDYEVTLAASVTDEDFRRQITQTRAPGDRVRNRLARALVRRSRDNMILALENYNRPSLTNRLDAFAMLFTTAWEQLLKAELIEQHSEAHIFRATKTGRRRESIGLDECVRQVFPKQRHPARLNIERIAELRHGATHLVMPELQPRYAQLFQAGVLNFARRFHALTGETLLPKQSVGLLALASAAEEIDPAPLHEFYGSTIADEIVHLAKRIDDEIAEVDDKRFAVPIQMSVRFGKGDQAISVSLQQASEAPTDAVVVEKPVDPDRTHPMRASDLQRGIQKQLDGTSFNSYDLQAVLHREKWRKSNNEYHRLQRNPDTPKYSEKAIAIIVEKINSDPGYIRDSRAKYAKYLRDKRKGSRGRL